MRTDRNRGYALRTLSSVRRSLCSFAASLHRHLYALISLFLLFVLVGGTGSGCGATPCPPRAESPDVSQRLRKLSSEIDELAARYEALKKENAAIEQLLSELGFHGEMDSQSISERVQMMQHFKRAEVIRTQAYRKLQEQLRTIAGRHGVETGVQVHGGQIAVRLAEKALFDPKSGKLRTDVTPLLWAIAESLKEFDERRFEIVSTAPPVEPQAPEESVPSKKPSRTKRTTPIPLRSPWEEAFQRSLLVMQALHGTGIGWERLIASVRITQSSPSPSERFLEIIVLPIREELPRVHVPEAYLTP